MRERQHAKLVFYQEGRDGWVIKYLADMPFEDQPLFVSDLNAVSKTKAFIIITDEHFNALPEQVRHSLKVISRGKVGRDGVVVLIMLRSKKE